MIAKPTIAFFGSSLVSAYWNGAATYYRGIIRALDALGYRITFFEPDAYERQQHRDIDDPGYARSVVYPVQDETGVRAALRMAGEYDIIIKASGVGVFDQLLEAAVLDLQTRDRPVIFWDVDAPATLDRVQQNPGDPFAKLIPQYDLILTYGGGDPVASAYRRLGACDCVPIYNALDQTTHYPTARDERFSGDLAFLGNRMPDREARVGEFFFTPAAMLPDRSFLLGGSGWADGRPDLPNIRYIGHVYTHEHNAFNCTPRAVLNVSRESMARYGFSPATRLFEVAGAGGCLITDAWEGIEQFLKPGIECLVAHNGTDVANYVRDLTPALAYEIGQAAHARMIAEHTYDHRARQVDRVFESLGNSAIQAAAQ